MAVAIPSSATLDASARFEAELWESHVADLRQQLRGAGLSTAGRKAQLVERILYATDWAEHDMGDASAAESEPEPEPEAVGRGSRTESGATCTISTLLDGGQQVGSGVGTIVAALSAWLIVATAFYTEYYGCKLRARVCVCVLAGVGLTSTQHSFTSEVYPYCSLVVTKHSHVAVRSECEASGNHAHPTVRVCSILQGLSLKASTTPSTLV
jgi:hypothetical protein